MENLMTRFCSMFLRECFAFLNPIPKGKIPFSTCHIDHFGPIDPKISVKKHILLVIDGFTKF